MTPRVTVQMPQTRDNPVELKGGMDQVTPTLKLHPGTCRRAMNFEAAINGGYTRIVGYERYDGQTSPSSVTFTLLPIASFSTTPTVGQTLTGATSGATATIIAVGAAYLAVTKVLVAAFQEGEIVTVAGVIIGAIGPQTVTLTKRQKKQYVNAAADIYRALIAKVPGSGPVRGVFGAVFDGAFGLYALRDTTAAGTFMSLYKATSAGWTVVHQAGTIKEINFKNGGPSAIADNTVCLEEPTLVARRVVLTTGSWASNTATGKIIYTGGTSPIGLVRTFNGTTVTMLATTEIGAGVGDGRLTGGGIVECVYENFYGQLGGAKIYAVDGVNRPWEFDGTWLVPIDTGDPHVQRGAGPFPSHCVVHQNHLFLGVRSSVMNSGIGEPFNWSAGAGAAEYTLGDDNTGFQILPGVQGSGALAVMSRNRMKILYGTAVAGPEPFDLIPFKTETGAVAGTLQTLDRVYYLDDRGVIDIKAAQTYGNFTTATLTRFIQKYIDQKRGRAVCSMIHRGKGQYRIFFNDSTGLYLTFDNASFRGAMPVSFPTPMSCAWSGEDTTGQEFGYVGGTDGYVYQMDRGTSFDGTAIDFELLLNWDAMGSPRQRKTIHRASVEIQDTDYTEFRVGARLGPAMSAHLQDLSSEQVTENELTMQWDHFEWDDFWWDAHADAPLEVDVKGTAERVQYVISGSSDYLDAFTLPSIITHYLPRRGLR